MRGPVGRMLAVLAAAGVLAAVGVAPASAHASLVSSNPAADASLDALPTEIVFTFSEPISEPAYAVLNSPDGEQLAAEEVVVDGETVSVAVTGDGPAGAYTAAFRVVSEDGHPVTGQIAFTVGSATSPGESDPSGEAGAEPTSDVPDDATDSTDSTASTEAPDSDPLMAAWQWAVGIGLFALAGVLWLLSRRRSGTER